MASIGLYAVIAASVGRWTREIGLRMAMGASSAGVAAMVRRNGGRQVAIGLIAGMAGAFAVTRVLSGILVQISSADPLTYLIVSTLLVTVAMLACWIPARRAMRVDPLVALRHE